MAGRSDVAALLGRAGFERVAETDVSSQYLHTARAWVRAWDRHRTGLEGDGCGTFEQDQRDKRAAVAAIEAGWLRRQFFTADRPL